jgi:hypothetical protein
MYHFFNSVSSPGENSCGESGKIGMAVLFGILNDFKNPPSSNGEATLNISEYHVVPHCLQLPHYTSKLFLSKYFTSGMKEEDGQDNQRKPNKSKIRIQIQK